MNAFTDGFYTYLPKEKVNVRALRYGLCYGNQPSDATVVGEYVRVPREFNTKLEIEDRRPVFKDIPNYPTKTCPRPYQVEPFVALCNEGGGILNLGCGYGKTVLAIYYVGFVAKKTAILLDKVNLISQWKSEILTHLDIPEDKIGVVQGKKWEWEDRDIVLCSIHTLSRRGEDVPEGFYESFGLAVFDECHHLAAPMFKKVCPRFGGIRLGLSATPQREDGLEQIFINHIGHVFYSKVDQDLIPDIFFIRTEIEEEFSDRKEVLDRSREVNHRKLCQALGFDTGRDRLIRKYVKELHKRGYHILCLSHSVEHVHYLADRLNSEGIPTGVAAGSVKPEERAEQIKSHPVSVATVDVASEALNVPSLSALVVLTPFGARVHGNILQQALGRIQRAHENKKHPIALFFEDHRVGMCNGLMRQVKRALTDKGYAYETKQPSTAVCI